MVKAKNRRNLLKFYRNFKGVTSENWKLRETSIEAESCTL